MELIYFAFYLGLISLAVQVALARMAVGFAGGNEIYLSLYFLFWLIFTGAGAFSLKKCQPKRLFFLLGIFITTLPSLFYLSPNIFGFLPGQLVPPYAYIAIIAAVLLPICFLNGGLFNSIAEKLSGPIRSGRTYMIEAAGSLTGGIITTVYYLCGGRDYSLLIGLALFSCVFISLNKKRWKAAAFIVSLAAIIFNWGYLLEETLLTYHYRPYEYTGSQAGRLVRYDTITTGEFAALYGGGVKLADFPDYASAAELFYWPYLAKPEMKRIAFIGGEMGQASGLIPNNVEASFIYPETNWRTLIDSRYLPPMTSSIITDPINFLKSNRIKYDAIVINRGSLLSLADKRLETNYFINLCRNNLTSDGVLCFNLESYAGLWRDDLKYWLNSIYDILGASFKNIAIVPGDRLILLASDDLTYDSESVITRYRNLHIDSPYFTEALVKARLNRFNLDQVTDQLNSSIEKPNTENDLDISYGLSYYFSKLNSGLVIAKAFRYYWLLLILALIIGLSLVVTKFDRNSSISLLNVVYFGLASFALELLAMYRIQLLGGYLYMALGIIVGLFMLGMALGSMLGVIVTQKANQPKLNIQGVNYAFGLFVLIAGAFMLNSGGEYIYLLIIGLAGFGGGLGFACASRRYDDKPGLPYGFDLAGGVIGTLLGIIVLTGSLNLPVILGGIAILGIILLATNKVLLEY